MAAYLEACIEEANGDAAFIAKALGDIAPYKGPTGRSVGSAKKGTRLPVNSAKGKINDKETNQFDFMDRADWHDNYRYKFLQICTGHSGEIALYGGPIRP